jgi:hypothetical protein
MREIMFVEEMIKGIRRIRGDNFVENMGVRMRRRVENMADDGRRKICIR